MCYSDLRGVGREGAGERREGERGTVTVGGKMVSNGGFLQDRNCAIFYNFKLAPLKSEQTEKNLIEPQLTDKEVLR